jgi:FdhE protein
MPFLALAPATRDARLALGAARWTALLLKRPDLQPAVALQQQLIGRLVDVLETLEHGKLPKLSLPGKYLAAKLARGTPALAGEPIPLPVALLTKTLTELCRILEVGGAGSAAGHIRSAIQDQRIDAGSLLGASVARDQEAIRTGAAHLDLAADLLWLAAELAVSPFAHALNHRLFSSSADSSLAEALAAWPHGYCPACGSWPALAERVKSDRGLRCSFCALAWTPNRPGCAYCGEQGDRFDTLGESRAAHAEICGACGSYLKVVPSAELLPFPLIAIADLETMEIDVAAMERGFSRPALKDFRQLSDRREPLAGL